MNEVGKSLLQICNTDYKQVNVQILKAFKNPTASISRCLENTLKLKSFTLAVIISLIKERGSSHEITIKGYLNILDLFSVWNHLDGYKKVTSHQEHGLKVLLAIGGWNDSEGSKYSALVARRKRRAKFITNVVTFLKEHNFNGLDIDWEFPRCWQNNCIGPAEDKTNFGKLVQVTRLRSCDKLTTLRYFIQCIGMSLWRDYQANNIYSNHGDLPVTIGAL